MDNVIASDVDGTLAFGEKSHGIRVLEENDKTYVVTTPDSSTTHQAYSVSTDKYKVYLALETRSLLRTLAGRHDIVLATAARPSTVYTRRESFDFVKTVVLENGGMILDSNYEIDRGWEAELEPQRKYLREVQAQLEGKGWVLDHEGRTSALRVRPRDNPHKGEDEFEELRREIQLPFEFPSKT